MLLTSLFPAEKTGDLFWRHVDPELIVQPDSNHAHFRLRGRNFWSFLFGKTLFGGSRTNGLLSECSEEV